MQNRHRPLARRPIQKRVALGRALESLESRKMFDSTPFVLSTGPLSQNWENTGLIATNDDWSGVPSFTGYLGSLVTATGGDPRTVLADTTVVDVNANQTASFGTGGVSEIGLATAIPATTPNSGNNTVGIQGSGTAVAPNLKAFLNTVGVTGVTVAFDVIDVDAGVATSNQQFVAQYRVGGAGNFTNIDSTYLAAAAPIGSTSGTINSFSVVLPAAVEGQALVEVRFITADAGGADQFLGIDNIVISATPSTTPGSFSIDPASAAISIAEGGGSATITVNRASGSTGAVNVPYTLGGTATAGSDYTAPSGTVSFATGETSKTIVIPIIDDTLQEPNETITVTLGTPTNGGTLGTGTTSTITITDNDVAGTVALSSATYSIIESGGVATITVNRTVGTTGAISVAYTLVGNTATAGVDFNGASGVVNFANGQASTTFTVPITSDSIVEPDETFTITLSTPTGGATIGTQASAVVTIVDDDSVAPTGLFINEVFVNPPSTNTPYQFIELVGTPGATLRNVYIFAIEGDIGTNISPGQVDGVIDLSGAVIGSNGVLLVRSAGGFAAEDPASGVIEVQLFTGVDPNFGLEVGSLSLLLVYGTPGTALPTLGTDLDADNAGGTDPNVGTLELLPAGFSTLDSVGQLDGNTSDLVYGTKIPAFGTNISVNAPDYFARLTPNLASAFYYADLVTGDAGETSSTKKLSPTTRSANTPADAVVTPGSLGVTPTTVTSVVFNSGGAGPQSITVTFNQDVSTSAIASDFELIDVANNTATTLVVQGITNGGKTVTLTFSGTGNTVGATVLNTANYRLRVKAGQVGTLATNVDTTFFFKNADFDRDRDVDFDDLLALARNYGATSGKTFAQGDANYDGDVDFDDLLALARNYGSSLAAPAAPALAATAPTRSRKTSFGESVIA